MSRDVVLQLRSYLETIETSAPPIAIAELKARLELPRGDNDLTAAESFDREVADTGADVCESCGADLTVFELRVPDESPAPGPRKHRALVFAVAAAILLVVGVVVVADGDSSDVVTDPVLSATTPEPVPSPTPPDPTPAPEEADPGLSLSVVDSLGFRWSQLPHDEAVFGVEGVSFDPVMTSVTAGGPGLVAVGTDGTHYESEGHLGEFGDAAVWTSVDGITWSRAPHDETVFGGAAMSSVTVGGPGLVAVGGTSAGAAVWTSVDGITWSRVPHDETVFGGDADMGRVTVGGPGLVAVGPKFLEGAAAVWTSADGLAWSRVPLDEEVFGGASIGDVTAGGPGLVAVGSAWLEAEDRGVAAVWTSVDGLTWSRVPYDEAMFGPGDEHWMAAVVVGGPGLVAGGWFANEDLYDQGTAVWTSVDGLTWSRLPYDEAVWGYGNVTSLVAVDSGLVAVGADYYPAQTDRGGRVWTSPDGITWSRAPHETFFNYSTIASVTVGGPGLVAVGDTFSSDSDGVVWTATPELTLDE
ncbi:MAG: sialidase family protein [Acidimicrobiales bacterium]